MNVNNAIRNYIQKIVSSVQGVKVLLVDEETKNIISVCYSQTEILKHEVFLVDMLENHKRQEMPNINAVIFVRPTNENILLLKEELNKPKYKEYRLFFSNVLSSDYLSELAQSDKRQLVKQVSEYYGDYVPLDKQLYSLSIDSVIPLLNNNWSHTSMDRITEGIISILLSLKKTPFIRYQGNSEACKRIAQQVSLKIAQEKNLFKFPGIPPHLLIIDRRDDPVTPLLTQWTYQSMIHELIGIENNRIVLFKEKENPQKNQISVNFSKTEKEIDKEIPISSLTDDFFKNNMYKNWGDLCMSIKKLVDEYQENSNIKENINSIEEMHNFLSNFGNFKKFTSSVDSHVSIVHEMKKIIQDNCLLSISELEQEMVCSDSHSEHLVELKDKLQDYSIKKEDCFKLVLLYAIRYETHPKNDLLSLMDLLHDKGFKANELKSISSVLKFAGKNKRNNNIGLFPGESDNIMKTFFTKVVGGGLKGETNIFTQHVPLIQKTLDSAFKGKLKQNLFPFMGKVSTEIPRQVIVFILGGVTYEESKVIHLKYQHEKKNAIIGGTKLLNANDFVNDIKLFHDDSSESIL